MILPTLIANAPGAARSSKLPPLPMIPERFQSSFSRTTLDTIRKQAARLVVRKVLFFRGACTAYVIESERRSFQPMVVCDATRIKEARCSCAPSLPPNDLCRHIAVMIERAADESGAMPSEQFEASIWKAIGSAAFAAGRAIETEEADPREQVLRRRVLTPQEEALLERGSASTKLMWESSAWYRWATAQFVDDPRGERARLDLEDGEFRLGGLAIAPAAMDALVAAGVAERSGFEVTPLSLEPSLRIEITPDRALRFMPVLLDRGVIYPRAALPQFGRWFLIGRRFASVASRSAMFDDNSAGQTSLFGASTRAGIPVDRETVIPEADVFRFLENHAAELSAMPAELVPDEIRNAKPVRLEGEVLFDFARMRGDSVELRLLFEHGLTGADVVAARRNGMRVLNRENVWIDVADPQFSCLDSLRAEDGALLAGKLDILRIRGSLRGPAAFRGDAECEPLFRIYDDMQAADAPAPASLGFDLYGYQQTGYQFLFRLLQNNLGALLCDDMGLGKTHQAMALIAAVTRVNPDARILVVCPTSVLDHWREKLARYAPGIALTLATYGIVRSRIEQFRGQRFDLIILDEMQTIKNSDTATHQALASIDRGVAVGLTGTPIENSEDELRTLLDFVVPGYLPGDVADRRTLQRLVRPFVLRRTKEQVLTELPPKIVDRRHCEMTDEQRALYRAVLESRARPLRAQLRAGTTVSYVHVFAALNYLKQICNHPASAGGGFGADVSSGKWDVFTGILEECLGSGLKVVVFSQYLRMLELIEEHLAARAVGFASIKGSTHDRGAEVARFRDDPSCRVFTASLRAGGLGIDLTSASVVIHYDRWWNQAREDQATDRVHRLGQNKGVQVIKLITRGTVEQKIDELIARKDALARDVIRPDDPSLVKQFTREELAELLAG